MAPATAQAITTADSQRKDPCQAWPRRVAIMNDYVRIPYANGSSFASQFLYRELEGGEPPIERSGYVGAGRVR